MLVFPGDERYSKFGMSFELQIKLQYVEMKIARQNLANPNALLVRSRKRPALSLVR